MPHVLAVTAFERGDPVAVLIAVKAYDSALFRHR
jgi:hypothetical protein